jgi:hypothetical protein
MRRDESCRHHVALAPGLASRLIVERMFGRIAFVVRLAAHLAAQWIGSDFSCNLYLP